MSEMYLDMLLLLGWKFLTVLKARHTSWQQFFTSNMMDILKVEHNDPVKRKQKSDTLFHNNFDKLIAKES